MSSVGLGAIGSGAGTLVPRGEGRRPHASIRTRLGHVPVARCVLGSVRSALPSPSTPSRGLARSQSRGSGGCRRLVALWLVGASAAVAVPVIRYSRSSGPAASSSRGRTGCQRQGTAPSFGTRGRTASRSPTVDAGARRACERPPPPLVSWRACRPDRRSAGRDVATGIQARRDPGM